MNTFGRKVILVSEIIFHQKNMKSAGLWVITMEFFVTLKLIQILRSFKTEHSAFKAVVTLVTLPYFCDSRYIL